MAPPISYVKSFVENPDKVFSALWESLAWTKHPDSPRREYYCNEVSVPYSYGRPPYERTFEPSPWHPAIIEIKEKLEKTTKTKFEVCFLNGYANQQDHIGWHSDDSPEMDDDRSIAIVSLGAEREIWFRDIPINGGKCVSCNGSGKYDSHGSPSCASCSGTGKQPAEDPYKIKLESGSLCLMLPGMQDTHQHRIPKAGFECGARVSLTFRGYVKG